MTLLNVPPSLAWPAQFCAFVTAATWIASLVTGNVSQVDRLWTFLPTIYIAYYAFLPLFPQTQPFFLAPFTPKELGWRVATHYSPRALLMFGLTFIWMCRLSYNTYRRGLFRLSDEDYRWQVLRSTVSPLLFQFTNLVFISGIQNVLLLLLGLPAKTAALQADTSLSASDYALAALALTLLLVEFTADNQQYAYHAYKHSYLAREKNDKTAPYYNQLEHWVGSRLSWSLDDAKRGFVTRGLWAYSRHPNFFCEQSFWLVITLLPLLAPSAPNLTTVPPSVIIASLSDSEQRKAWFEEALYPAAVHLLPALSLSALFFSSTLFTESISKKKYPQAYAAYQKRVGMFSPLSTLRKFLRLYLFASPKDRSEINRLVWGEVYVSDKTE
ncbi:hypothetical protein H1R20_g14216, partial [Candolleomyces eurysporus]